MFRLKGGIYADGVLMEWYHMAEDVLINNKIAPLLIKEYAAMKTELREYIRRKL